MKPNADVSIAIHQQAAVQALKSFTNRFDAEMKGMGRSVDETNRRTKEGEDNLKGWLGSMGKILATAGGISLAFGGIHKMIALVRREFEVIHATQQKAAGLQLNFNDVMAQIHYQNPPNSCLSVNRFCS